MARRAKVEVYEPDVFCGTFEDVMPTLEAESAQLIFTSAPYGVGQDYEPDIRFGVLLQLLNRVFRETERVLKRGGYAVFNFGDLIPGRELLGTKEPCEMPMGWLYWAFGLGNGLVLQAQRVWQKEFSKITGGKHAISAPRPVPEFEHLYTFRKTGGAPQQAIRNRQISQRAVWSTVGEGALRSKHPAAFPPGLVRRVIEVYTDPGDLVVDPFAGSGTVEVVCKELGRACVLIEKEPGYVDEIKERLAEAR
jgi:adenine-specific DNA-methyltransferase